MNRAALAATLSLMLLPSTALATPVAVTASSDADADLVAVSVFGNSTARYTCLIVQACVRGVAVSAFGDANSSVYCREIGEPHTYCAGGAALSALGDARAVGHAAISGWGNASNCCDLTASLLGDADGGILATSIFGDASALSAVSIFGNAVAQPGQCYAWVVVYPLIEYCAGSYAISVFGNASGDNAVSVCRRVPASICWSGEALP